MGPVRRACKGARPVVLATGSPSVSAEHDLATAADEVEQRYPDDPYAQRVAEEVGLLSGALKALLEAVRPTLEQAS